MNEIQTYLDNGGKLEDLPLKTRLSVEEEAAIDTQVNDEIERQHHDHMGRI